MGELMSIIKAFRNYMEIHHQALTKEDWIADVRRFSPEELNSRNLKTLLLQEIDEPITCWLFYYENSYREVVFLLQDKRGIKNIAISLLKNGEPVHPVSFQ